MIFKFSRAIRKFKKFSFSKVFKILLESIMMSLNGPNINKYDI